MALIALLLRGPAMSTEMALPGGRRFCWRRGKKDGAAARRRFAFSIPGKEARLKSGRRSRAEYQLTDLVVVDVGDPMPASPPPELSDPQAAVWRDAVASMSGAWLRRGAHAVLIEYTRHVCRARLLEQEIAHFEQQWIAAPGGLERLDRLLAAGDRETKAAIACARALR